MECQPPRGNWWTPRFESKDSDTYLFLACVSEPWFSEGNERLGGGGGGESASAYLTVLPCALGVLWGDNKNTPALTAHLVVLKQRTPLNRGNVFQIWGPLRQTAGHRESLEFYVNKDESVGAGSQVRGSRFSETVTSMFKFKTDPPEPESVKEQSPCKRWTDPRDADAARWRGWSDESEVGPVAASRWLPPRSEEAISGLHFTLRLAEYANLATTQHIQCESVIYITLASLPFVMWCRVSITVNRSWSPEIPVTTAESFNPEREFVIMTFHTGDTNQMCVCVCVCVCFFSPSHWRPESDVT